MQSPQLDMAAEAEDSIWHEEDNNENAFGPLLDDAKEELKKDRGSGMGL